MWGHLKETIRRLHCLCDICKHHRVKLRNFSPFITQWIFTSCVSSLCHFVRCHLFHGHFISFQYLFIANRWVHAPFYTFMNAGRFLHSPVTPEKNKSQEITLPMKCATIISSHWTDSLFLLVHIHVSHRGVDICLTWQTSFLHFHSPSFSFSMTGSGRFWFHWRRCEQPCETHRTTLATTSLSLSLSLSLSCTMLIVTLILFHSTVQVECDMQSNSRLFHL